MKPELRHEILRKTFHQLSLVYVAAYHVLGRETTLWALGAWLVVEGSVEAARLRIPAVNRLAMSIFGGIHRKEEEGRISGIFWTSLGCWLTILFCGQKPAAVTAAILYLALGDAAAAIAGRSWGRIKFRIRGRTKSLEGSAACLAVCLAVGWAAGLPAAGVFAGATAATVIEFVPLPLDDNLWMPLVSGVLLLAFV